MNSTNEFSFQEVPIGFLNNMIGKIGNVENFYWALSNARLIKIILPMNTFQHCESKSFHYSIFRNSKKAMLKKDDPNRTFLYFC